MMRKRTLYFLASAIFATLPAFADAQVINQPPQCPAKTVVMANLPSDVDLTSFQIDPILVAPECTDPDGDEMAVTAVSSQAYIEPDGDTGTDQTIKAGQSVVITFTVSDGHGGETTSTLTVKR